MNPKIGLAEPDFSQIQQWSTHLRQQEKAKAGTPESGLYAGSFPGGLIYVAVANHKKPDPTCQLIRDISTSENFDVAMIEGVSYNLPGPYLKFVEEAAADNFKIGGESAYTTFLALNRVPPVPVHGWEPTESEVVNYFEAQGFNRRDYYHFRILRELPELMKQKEFNGMPLEKAYRNYSITVGLATGYHKNNCPDLADFMHWHETMNGKIFDPYKIDPEETAPLIDGSFPSQRFSAKLDDFRNQTGVRVVFELLKEHPRILGVGGKGHLIAQRKALEAMLGPMSVIAYFRDGLIIKENVNRK